jgi:hypothetical protein
LNISYNITTLGLEDIRTISTYPLKVALHALKMDDFFATKPDPNGDADDECLPEQSDALKDYLHGRKRASETAQALTRPVIASQAPEDELSRLYAFLYDALVELPSEHIPAVLDLIQAVEELPEPDFTSIPESQRPDDKLWKGLSDFATLWYDVSYKSGSWKMDAEISTGEKRDELRKDHVAKAIIEAQLVIRGLAGVPIGWGYEVVDDALGSRASRILQDFEVPAAAEWLEICGRRFWQGAQEGEKSYVYEEGMSLEQWDKWEKRFEELQGREGVVGSAAKKALDAMHKATND